MNYLNQLNRFNRVAREIVDLENEKIIILRRQLGWNNPMNSYSDNEFKTRFRLSKESAINFLSFIIEDLKRTSKRGLPVPPLYEFLIVLRFYANDSFQIVSGDLVNISQPSISRSVKRVSRAIAKLKSKFISMPLNDEIDSVQQEFAAIAGFPGVVGAIDGTHIKILAPGVQNRERFRDRKNNISLNIQVVCDAKQLITNIVSRWPGSVHDSRIFNNSELCAKFENKEIRGWLLGDNGYPNRSYILTPLIHANTMAEKRYNKSHCKTRNIIERLFGQWKRRFPCINTCLNTKLSTTLTITIAVAVLWNFTKLRNDNFIENNNYENCIESSENSFPDTSSGNAIRRRLIETHFSNMSNN